MLGMMTGQVLLKHGTGELTMYKELIEKMRCCSGQLRCGDCRFVEDCAGKKMLLNEAADAIERLHCFNALWQEAAIIAHEREPKWIPVTERLPNKSGRYLTVLEENGIQHMYVAIFQNKFNLPAGKMSHWKVTHWMPLPEPPKEE